MSDVQVLLVDDDHLVRAGFVALLGVLSGIEVIGEAANGRAALSLVKEKRPDVVLMDVVMPEMNGVEAAGYIVRTFPDVAVLMLSTHAGERSVSQAMKMGASGYVSKTSTIEELEAAIKSVARGNLYLGTRITGHLGPGFGGDLEFGETSLDRLTPRQREILQLIAEGFTSKEIAQKLDVKRKTVETHRAQLMQRLNIHGVAGLVRYAIRMGLIDIDL